MYSSMVCFIVCFIKNRPLIQHLYQFKPVLKTEIKPLFAYNYTNEVVNYATLFNLFFPQNMT